jgi:hypothetical protein
MPFGREQGLDDVFTRISEMVSKTTGLMSKKGNDILGGREPVIQTKVHRAIDHATLVIGILSPPSENVYDELGYALGRKRDQVVLMSREHTDAAVGVNLRGVERIEYPVP